ncbi:MAG: 1-aminocyclopropane-1-carboxylate deaminase/D-cysteine desulfhydrase [Longimicrobiales bacterium]
MTQHAHMPRDRRDLSPLQLLARLPRTHLAHTPTPLLPAPALAAHIGAQAGLFIKADAWTGFGLGGNKVRKLEHELSPERLDDVTHLVTAGGPQSNHCRVTAAAAAHLGLSCTLVINGRPPEPPTGNAALHRLLGAEVVSVADRSDRNGAMEERAESIAAGGGKALVVPLGASTPRGALGYAHAMAELHDQIVRAGENQLKDDPVLFVAASSGGTLAGLWLGAALLNWHPTIVAVSADDPASSIRGKALELAIGAIPLLPPAMVPDRATLQSAVQRAATEASVREDFVGDGYGLPTRESEDATSIFGRHGGIVLDPVYTSKAAAALLALLDGKRPAVFLHTGGHPALFR